MVKKIHIKNNRGTSAHVDPDALDVWLADKKEGWAVVDPVKKAKAQDNDA